MGNILREMELRYRKRNGTKIQKKGSSLQAKLGPEHLPSSTDVLTLISALFLVLENNIASTSANVRAQSKIFTESLRAGT
ncbi:hypothetical protein Anapl_08619 [Anas platyrhynchos]|uniref:Uncharacterized protein n=1 Tax=Anas platyrhynchos TaxID=8839 RepID=R0LZY2_ANAPL|nr:hypothetical protein Anapl_08619 [Anas platyrhynchos]